MWSIEEERKQAQDFAFRASVMEDLGQTGPGEIFRELVALCDRKIELFKQLESQREAIASIRPRRY